MNANTKEKYDNETKNFETLKYNISGNTDILLDDSCDPDINFFNKKFQSLETPYLMPGEFHNFLDISSDQFSVLCLNIMSIKKTFENFKLFLSLINFNFSVICLSETWWNDLATIEKSLYELPNYNSTNQATGDHKGGGVSINIHKSLGFTVKPDLSIYNNDIESLTIEILSNKKRKTLINAFYRLPNGQIEPFENFLNNIFSKIKKPNKLFHIADDFNLKLLDHDTNRKVQRFLNIIYRNGMIPTITKPIRVTQKTTTIEHILANSFTDTVFKTAIFKSDIPDHFPICLIIPSSMKQTSNKKYRLI